MEHYYQGVGEGDAAEVDKILAIIGPAGTDVSALFLEVAKKLLLQN
jgi:pyruvate dehydrogenase E2 component (dihydrolipoamide acetyltransferase)